jgi:hypothetical protein
MKTNKGIQERSDKNQMKPRQQEERREMLLDLKA